MFMLIRRKHINFFVAGGLFVNFWMVHNFHDEKGESKKYNLWTIPNDFLIISALLSPFSENYSIFPFMTS
jgi:hypothetical protein